MKNKLFIPRKLSNDDSRYAEWNNQQPIKDGKRINQYDPEGNKTGYWEEYYYDGTLEFKGSYKNKKLIGEWKDYFLTGELNQISFYSNTGRKIGKWIIYDRYGYVMSVTEYKNNSLKQMITYHHKSNIISSITNYKNDFRNGLKTIFHKNGKPKEKKFYLNNVIDKWSFKYSKTGELIRIIQRNNNDSIEYLLSKNAKKNKITYWRFKIISGQKISQEEITDIINQAKLEARFQV